jgi:uncharacterized protein HemY
MQLCANIRTSDAQRSSKPNLFFMDRIARIQEMLEKQPDDAFLYHALGLEYLKNENQAEAEKMFIRSLAKNKDHVGTYYHLVNLLAKAGRTNEAIQWCEKGLPACKRVGDEHAWRELNTLYEDLIF